MIRVLLVDDQPLLRLGMSMVIEPETDIEVVGEARPSSVRFGEATQRWH